MKYLILFLLAPGWVMASEMSERLACMEALSKFEYGDTGGKIQVDLSGHTYYWDGKGIFEKILHSTEIWDARRFREKGEGRLDVSFPSSRIEQIQAFVIKDSFKNLLSLSKNVSESNVDAMGSYFQSCMRVADVTIDKVPIGKLAKDKLDKFRMTKESAPVLEHELKQEASAGK